MFANIHNKSLNRQISKDLIYKYATYFGKHVTIYHSIHLLILPGFRFNSNRSEGLLGFVLTPTFPTVSATPVRKPMNRGSEAAVCREYSYAALSVQGCCTVGARLLHHRYTYAGLTVYLYWTDGIPMLDYRYTYAELSVYLC